MTKCFLKRKLREAEHDIMNARQAAKAAAKRIEELEDFNMRASAEIKNLNRVIDSVIAGEKTYCEWCEEDADCERPCKGKGCSEWWLMLNPPVEQEEGSDADDGKRVPVTGSEGRA